MWQNMIYGTLMPCYNRDMVIGSMMCFVLVISVGCSFFFFFQAEDGIRDLTVTGVQTCALPIFEVMGRHAGWIALNAGLASGAHMTLIPEQPYDVEEVCRLIKQRFVRGDSHFI